MSSRIIMVSESRSPIAFNKSLEKLFPIITKSLTVLISFPGFGLPIVILNSLIHNFEPGPFFVT